MNSRQTFYSSRLDIFPHSGDPAFLAEDQFGVVFPTFEGGSMRYINLRYFTQPDESKKRVWGQEDIRMLHRNPMKLYNQSPMMKRPSSEQPGELYNFLGSLWKNPRYMTMKCSCEGARAK